MDTSWKFDQAPRCAVFTVRGIIEDGEPVLHVTHDVDDHGWQFLGLDTPREADARIVALEEMLEIAPSLRKLADLPIGWHAWRESVGDDWVRELNPNVDG